MAYRRRIRRRRRVRRLKRPRISRGGRYIAG